MYIIFLGAPGAGKGTQAVMLAEKLNLEQVASGDLFRQALQNETELGLKAKSYMEKGMLVPDKITTQMVLDRISAPDIIGRLPKNSNRIWEPITPGILSICIAKSYQNNRIAVWLLLQRDL